VERLSTAADLSRSPRLHGAQARLPDMPAEAAVSILGLRWDAALAAVATRPDRSARWRCKVTNGSNPRGERTLILVKPDGVQRALVGEILQRFERAGLKIVALEMRVARRDLLERHYPNDETFLSTIGGKTKEAFDAYGLDLKERMGTDDPREVGARVRGWLIDFMASAPVVAAVLEGVHAVSIVRKLVGKTLPVFAEPGTIRGDFAIDSPTLANLESRPVRNLIHASGTLAEAAFEVDLWFSKDVIHAYERPDERAMFGTARES
jgi:nucleoside-diphosphate kinase